MLHKFLMMISKGFGFIYVYIKYHTGNRKKVVDNKKILIIFGGHLGNAVLNIDTILQIKNGFPSEDGYSIHIMCHESIRKILETLEDFRGITFLDISYPYQDGGTRFATVTDTIRKMKGMEFDKIVVNLAHIMPLASYIVACIPSNDSIGVFDDLDHVAGETKDIEHNVGNARWYFQRAYKTAITVDYNTQEVQRQKKILEHLGIRYKTRIYPIKKLCDFECKSNDYFTVTVDSASSYKNWAPENFAELINLLCEKYDHDVCISGGKGSESIYDKIEKKIRYPERVYNYIGKTSFIQWVEMIRAAKFHIGVDSASIHIAASVGTQAFCMIGVWDGTRVMPYRIEEENSLTCSPICIYMEDAEKLPCYGCYPKRGVIGGGNETCTELCRNGDVCYCLKKIRVNDVFSVVDSWLQSKR